MFRSTVYSFLISHFRNFMKKVELSMQKGPPKSPALSTQGRLFVLLCLIFGDTKTWLFFDIALELQQKLIKERVSYTAL